MASTPHPTAVLFARGTLARLALWPALRLAVHASWGGPASAEKQRWLAGVLVDQFEPFLLPSSARTPAAPVPVPVSATGGADRDRDRDRDREPPPDAAYVEELLLQIMADEFDVALEDDSAAAVARDIITLFEGVSAGDEAFVKALEEQADKVRGKVPKHEMVVGSEDESASASDWEDEEGETENEQESVPALLDHSAKRPEEPQVDEDGFTTVKRKGRR